jgi:BMFP domain-containing protein YqiC
MAPDTQVSPDAETQIQAPEVESELTTPEVAADASTEATEVETEDEAAKALKRMQRRIDKRTADVYRARAENEQLQQRLAKLEAGTTEQPKGQDDPVSMAREIARIERFTEKSNELVAKGQKAHSDYMDALKTLAIEVGDFVAPNGAPSKFMDVVLQVSDQPEALLYHLGKNADLAEELADLSPIQLAKKLSRIEAAMADASRPQTPKSPKPLEPVKATSSDSSLGSHLSTAEWMKRREAELKAKRG